MNVLAACGGPDSPVRKVVFKSSAHYYGCERDDPSFFTEAMQRPQPPRTRLESDIVEADDAVQGFATRNPAVTVTTLTGHVSTVVVFDCSARQRSLRADRVG